MGMFDNPSAGKFDPPPGAERFDPPRPARRGAWIAAALGIAVFALEQSDHWWHVRGGWEWLPIALILILAAIQFTARRRLEPEEDKPYSDPKRITR